MKYAEDLKTKLCREIDKIGEKSSAFTTTDIEYLYKMTDIIKNLNKIEMLEQGEGDDMSHRGNSYGDMSMRRGRGRSYNNSYDGGSYGDSNSYGDGYSNRHYVRGHYSREDGMSHARDGYSRADAKDHMLNQIGELMEDASPKVREALKDAMHKIQDER